MEYSCLQQYWWFVVSLLGALLVFLLFVQGANSQVLTLPTSDAERDKLLHATGSKWEITFTTLVTFGGAFFASFPLFYSTSFGGAYWLWMVILFSFVLQPVSYEFYGKIEGFFGKKVIYWFLIFNGIIGPLLLGGAVATFFNGSNFVIEKGNLLGAGTISAWANMSHGLDALLDPWNVVLGLAVVFLARILGLLYVINSVENENMRNRASSQLVANTVPFLVFFLAFLVRLMLKDGFAVNPDTGEVYMKPMKYLHNLLDMWYLIIVLLIGVGLVLYGIIRSAITKSYIKGIWHTGIGTVLTVLVLFLIAGWNNTAFYPSNADLQSSLTISNACSSATTLSAMAVVSLLVPFVLAYIAHAWRALGKTK